MSDDNIVASPVELGRWLLVVLVIVTGIILFFVFGPSTEPAILPTSTQVVP